MVIDEKQIYANMPHVMVCGQMLTSGIHPAESQMYLCRMGVCYGIATFSTPTGCISKDLDLKTGRPSPLYLYVT